MDCNAFKREALAHYIRMAQTPGWKAQAWHSVNELAKNHPCLFADMPELLKQAMQSLSSAPAADSPTSVSGSAEA